LSGREIESNATLHLLETYLKDSIDAVTAIDLRPSFAKRGSDISARDVFATVRNSADGLCDDVLDALD
jgi:hypothetical protein